MGSLNRIENFSTCLKVYVDGCKDIAQEDSFFYCDLDLEDLIRSARSLGFNGTKNRYPTINNEPLHRIVMKDDPNMNKRDYLMKCEPYEFRCKIITPNIKSEGCFNTELECLLSSIQSFVISIKGGVGYCNSDLWNPEDTKRSQIKKSIKQYTRKSMSDMRDVFLTLCKESNIPKFIYEPAISHYMRIWEDTYIHPVVKRIQKEYYDTPKPTSLESSTSSTKESVGISSNSPKLQDSLDNPEADAFDIIFDDSDDFSLF